ncbi:hypothetical protein AC1031_000910 [Aphanomyces cochlioides]|nr:hypothetical protein AC1031_000910 [Aphanomyces cochlioides]
MHASSLRASVLLLLVLSLDAKTAQEICASPTCNRAGGGAIAMDAAALVAPCVAADMTCFAYNSQGACPFTGMVDCSKVSSTTTAAPTTTTAAPSTTASTTSAPSTTAASKSDSSGGGGSSSAPYIIGGACGVIAIGVLVFVLIRKSSRRNADEDELDSVEYAKPAPVTKEDPTNANNSSFVYLERPDNSYVEPLRANKSFVQGHDLQRQNTGSFIQDGGARAPNQYASNHHAPIARANTASFLQNNPGAVAVPVAVPASAAHDTKEQFFVPETDKEFPTAPPDHGRRESFEF